MRIVTSEQMREYDRYVIEQVGLPGAVLMENAGAAVAQVIAQTHGALAGAPVALFCGGGNNGGDGFVVARRLALLGAHPTVYLFGKEESLKADAATHLQVLRRMGLPVVAGADPHQLVIDPNTALAVDALLGTGSKGAPREPIRGAIVTMNRLACPIYAVDIPSGIDSDTGAVPAEAVRATHTITLACPKIGLFLFPAADYVGQLHVSDIGFCWDALELPSTGRLFSPQTSSVAATICGPRHPNANKGHFGHVAVLAGSQGMVGAPALVARAAQRAGAGLVTVLTPRCIQPVLAAKLDEQMTLPLADGEGALNEEALPDILRFAQKATLFCIGPGLTTHPQTVALVQHLLGVLHKPIVLDADGLNALAQNPECLRDRPEEAPPLILTPHPGEAARLLGTTTQEIESDRVGAVKLLASRFRAIALLKGRYTLIATPDGTLFVNTTGNPGMATGGSGDSLTGILGGILAQVLAQERNKTDIRDRMDVLVEAVALATYLHGRAGDLACQTLGEAALTAGDIIHHLPMAFDKLLVEPSPRSLHLQTRRLHEETAV
ncbi:NAD(P)H-hydrate dehydratase [Chthonomonas calidirosea]|uniref:NAD(P)H-hydrate dehydratase n=1 Tax=Chthonomonas calidirosea TaxID=454171 RepID=UPI0006EC466B|nr:NAD(P)H-hydrate dehydratase [Chthonomonas calidirosea]CEK18911.1 yjeF-like protein, hydroxyethylthiazole kinase-related [Chthonomonas calidirosea]